MCGLVHRAHIRATPKEARGRTGAGKVLLELLLEPLGDIVLVLFHVDEIAQQRRLCRLPARAG